MLKLRTTTEFTVPTERGVTQSIIRMSIDGIECDINNIRVKGYYYRIDNDAIIVMSKIDKLILKSDYEAIEANLAALESTTSLFANFNQRLTELTFILLQMEETTNYNTLSTDWEIDA